MYFCGPPTTTLKHAKAIVELMANATHSLFDTQERLMDILGVSILEDRHHLYNTPSIEKHSQSLLKNPDVVAFGVDA